MKPAEKNQNRTQERNGQDGRDVGKRGRGHRNEIAVGVAIVLAVLFVFFGVRFLEDRPLFGGTFQLTTEFDQANGLLPGNAVKISGVQIGEVKDVELLPEGHRVLVRMQIRDGVVVPQGSVATIEGVSALDNVSIGIKPGAEGQPPLEDGASIPSRPTASMMERVNSTLAGAENTFDHAESLIAGTERDVDVVLANMRSASGEVAAILQNERGRLHGTLIDLRSTSAQLDGLTAKLDRAAEEGGDSLAVAMEQLNAVMRRLDLAVGRLERSSSSLEAVMAQIESGRGTFGRLVYDESLYTRLDSAAVHLESILADFQKNPGKYLEQLELVDVF